MEVVLEESVLEVALEELEDKMDSMQDDIVLMRSRLKTAKHELTRLLIAAGRKAVATVTP